MINVRKTYLYYILSQFLLHCISVNTQLMENFEQNICRLSRVLVQFQFTTSETELDYYHHNVSTRVAKRLKTCQGRKFQENP